MSESIVFEGREGPANQQEAKDFARRYGAPQSETRSPPASSSARSSSRRDDTNESWIFADYFGVGILLSAAVALLFASANSVYCNITADWWCIE